MKILVVGAGALGGYFGGRLHEKGEDVTFLVRERRKAQLDKDGLIVESVNGDFKIDPKTITAGEKGQFDLILFGTKSYHLNEAIETVKSFAHDNTVIIPVLNGIAHIEKLQAGFSKEQVVGGVCYIESTLTNEGVIRQTSGAHHLTFGELGGQITERMKRIEDVFSHTKAKFKLSDSINEDLWNKYLFISMLSGVTTLFGQPAGPIRDLEEGLETVKGVIKEITAIIRAEGAPLPDNIEEDQFARFMALDDGMKSSMQRDMEKGLAVEVDHLQGYLLEKARVHQVACPILTAIYTNLKLYEQTV